MSDLMITVLVVEDSEFARRAIVRNLRDIGFIRVLEAGDGLEALASLERAQPAVGLVLSDWSMPKCDGLELLRRLRRAPKYAAVPFVFVTAVADLRHVAEALGTGASDYIVKPSLPSTFARRIVAAGRRNQEE